MSGETSNIADVANKISADIFDFFRWERVPVMDTNFRCEKSEMHFPSKKTESQKGSAEKHHPVDVVFRYFDPYLNKYILLNTDLKCYSSKSISTLSIQNALESLAKTVDCARVSSEWKGRYNIGTHPIEIRALCFLYNHDNNFHKEIENLISDLKLDKIPLKQGQVIHLLDPVKIRYLTTVVADIKHLQSRKELPQKKYNFFYPDLILHKIHSDKGSRDRYPATIETLCSPFMVIQHDAVEYLDEDSGEKHSNGNSGYVIYYNQKGETDFEFMYLFDYLSRFQILISKKSIKIRVAHHSPSPDLKSNFRRAQLHYLELWGNDESRKNDLERIEIETVSIAVPYYNPGLLAWRLEND